MQKIFFLHSAGPQGLHEGSSDFISWLEAELGAAYEIRHPSMPDPEAPDYEPWKQQLDKEFESLEGDVVVIGHSLGGSVLLKYLSTNQVQCSIAGLFLCAAPFWGQDSDWQYQPFTLSPQFGESLPPINQLHVYHSKNDPFVPFKHAELYKARLPRSILHTVEGDSHTFDKGIKQLSEDIRSLAEEL